MRSRSELESPVGAAPIRAVRTLAGWWSVGFAVLWLLNHVPPTLLRGSDSWGATRRCVRRTVTDQHQNLCLYRTGMPVSFVLGTTAFHRKLVCAAGVV